MTSREFCYWLQGLFELDPPEDLDSEQTELIRRHLALVFKHEIDPSAGSAEHQAELSAVHEGKPLATKEDIEKAVKAAVDAMPSPEPAFDHHSTLIRC
jgi:hypothetical protein